MRRWPGNSLGYSLVNDCGREKDINHSLKGDPFSLRDDEKTSFLRSMPTFIMPFHLYANLSQKGYKDSGNVTYTNLKPCFSVISYWKSKPVPFLLPWMA